MVLNFKGRTDETITHLKLACLLFDCANSPGQQLPGSFHDRRWQCPEGTNHWINTPSVASPRADVRTAKFIRWCDQCCGRILHGSGNSLVLRPFNRRRTSDWFQHSRPWHQFRHVRSFPDAKTESELIDIAIPAFRGTTKKLLQNWYESGGFEKAVEAFLNSRNILNRR